MACLRKTYDQTDERCVCQGVSSFLRSNPLEYSIFGISVMAALRRKHPLYWAYFITLLTLTKLQLLWGELCHVVIDSAARTWVCFALESAYARDHKRCNPTANRWPLTPPSKVRRHLNHFRSLPRSVECADGPTSIYLLYAVEHCSHELQPPRRTHVFWHTRSPWYFATPQWPGHEYVPNVYSLSASSFRLVGL